MDDQRAEELALSVMADIRQTFGGCIEYVARLDIPDRNRRVRKAFNGSNRDAVCAAFGISRRTFYRIIGGSG
jgi:hypothetical protein